MNSHSCSRVLKVCSFVVLLLMSWSAFAGELAKPGERVTRPAQAKREAAPLLYVLPSLGTDDSVVMEIRVFQGKRQFITEIVKLPAHRVEGATVDVLLTHPKELNQLRAIEKTAPGSLRFITLVEERVITDEPFAAIEARGANLSLDSAVGEIYEVTVRPAPKLRAEAKDWCEDNCYYQYDECYARCDERGDSCAICSNELSNCLRYCPQPCTEPKSESNYNTYTPITYYYYGENGCFSNFHPWYYGDRWEYRQYIFLVKTWHRVEHCDGSYTDTQTGQYYADYWCWYNTYGYCGPTQGYPPFPQC